MKIAIIGAGASGMIAAIMAARQGAEVLMIEQAEKVGKKIYATGNGRCNLTNTDMQSSYFRGHHTECVQEALQVLSEKETLTFFEELGLRVTDKNGYIYPISAQASTVVMVLASKCRELGVEILCNTMVTQIFANKQAVKKNVGHFKFLIDCKERIRKEKKQVEERNFQIKADKVILATGSQAGGFGCEVTGYEFAKAFGHHIYPVVPALTGMKCQEKKFLKQTAGVRCQGKISLYAYSKKEEQMSVSEENLLGTDCGEIQLTDYGISGIVAFQLARFASYALLEGKKVLAEVDFMTEFSERDLYHVFHNIMEHNPQRRISEVLCGVYPFKLAEAMLKELGLDLNVTAQEFIKKEKQLRKLCHTFKHFCLHVLEVNDIKNAQVCAGGVDTSELTKDFMSTKEKDLYMTGELLDIDGICGGYNLQFAWSSGYVAGLAAGKDVHP